MRRARILPWLLLTLLPVIGLDPATAGTVVHLGEIREFNGPDDLELDPDRVVVAVDVFGDADRLVNGVLFRSDKGGAVGGASVSATNSIDGWATRPSYSGADPASASNLELIMQDIRWEAAPNPVRVTVDGLTPGIEYQLQMLFNEGGDHDRRWDIAVEGELAVDDFSSEGEGVWSPTNGFAYIAPVTLDPGDTTLDVEMRQHLGGQGPLGSDNNPILQAFSVTEVTIPPTPESLELEPREFFAGQTAPVGTFTTTDLKRNATHLHAFVDGGADNDKFEIDGDLLVPGPHDFTGHPPGTTFTIRVRTADAEDPARFLDRTFTLALAEPAAPTGLSFSASSISAGAVAGTPVGRLAATDPNAVDAHIFTLAAGEGDEDNALFVIDGDWVRLVSTVPAVRDSVSLRLRATDLAGLSFEQGFVLAVTEPSLRLNEVMASNATTVADEDGDASDWIEIFNEQGGTANLNGWFLTDDLDDLTKWRFPAVDIGPNGFLVIFASGKDRAPADGGELHTGFRLGSGGEVLTLVEPDGVTVADRIEVPAQLPDVAFGLDPFSGEAGFLVAPTPGEINGGISEAVVNEVAFSHERGFYDAGFQLVLEATVPGSTIRYTTNGQKPTATSGSLYAGPIPITPETSGSTRGTRRIRAVAVHPSAVVAPVATHTYLFVEGVSSPGTDGILGQSVFQSVIRNHPTYGPLIDDGLLALPAVSIVRPGGISASEQETSIELFAPDGSEPGFQVDCGIKIVGGASTGSAKNNFRCYFRSEYGASKLKYDLFADHPYTLGTSDEFDVLQLRGGSHDNFYWLALPGNPPVGNRHGDAQYVRNRWIADVEMLMGHPSLHGRFVHCFLNGVYHGLYHLHERPMHHFMDKYFGGEPEDYHYTNSGRTGSDHGGGDSWSATWAEVKRAAAAGGQASRDWINWESLADYQLLTYYCGNDWDWSTTHNWMAAGPKEPGRGGWRFFSWDSDIMLQDVNNDNLDQNAPDGVFTTLMRDPDFQVFFRDRVYRHCFHDGLLAPGGLQASYDYRMREIFDAIVPETARWQPSSSYRPPWDRDDEWQDEWDYMTDVFWVRRTDILLGQLRARGWFPVDAPEFQPRGGQVAPGFSPVIEAGAGTIHVTTDGSDPRLPGGAVNPDAIAVNGSSKTTVLVPAGSVWRFLDDGSDQGSAWRMPGFDDSAWSQGPAQLGYGDGDETTVVGFGGNGADKHVTTYFRRTFLVEDASAVTGVLVRLQRDDGAVVHLNGTEVWRDGMPAGAITSETLANVGAAGADESTFFTRDDVPTALLVDGVNTLAVEVHQNAPTSSDLSFDLELAVESPTDPSAFQLDAASVVRARVLRGNEWSPVSEARFTIGIPADAGNLVVSEFSYRPAGPAPAENPGGLHSATDYEFIELTNIAPEPIHLDGVRFTDGISFDFADAGVIGLGAGESLLLVENREAFLARYPDVPPSRIAGEYDGNLSNDGERLEIVGRDGAVIRAFTFNDRRPWPEAADGDGFSLELVDPAGNPDHAIASNWRASRGMHGSPAGAIVPLDFEAWRAGAFSAAQLADPAISGPHADADGDGFVNFAEFVLGGAPRDPASPSPGPRAAVREIGGAAYLALDFEQWDGAVGVTSVVEISDDLRTWRSGPEAVLEVMPPVDHGDGMVTRTFRAAEPVAAGAATSAFIRLKMTSE